MSGFLRYHVKADGTPKRAFPTHADAMREQIRSGKGSAYRCKFCRQWHVGGRKSKP